LTKQALHAGKKIRCILFDFGDTLWTRNPVTYGLAESRARLRAVQVVSSYIDPRLFPTTNPEEFGHILYKKINEETRVRIRQNIGYEPDYVDIMTTAVEQLGLPHLERTVGEAIYEALRVRIPESRVVFPDTYETLKALQERGYILGVVTNRGYGGVPFLEDMRAIEFDRYFDLSAMAVSLDLGIRKPNPDIFLYALHKLDVEPGEAAMVGDSLYADIQGANLLDIFSIWRPKERIREEVKISRMRSSTQTAIAEQTSETIADIEENDNDVFPEKEEVYQYVQQNPRWERHVPDGDVRPGHIIYALSELLEIF